MSSDNRIQNEKVLNRPRLSLRLTRKPNLIINNALMSPKTTSVSLSSSSASKEVPRAALYSPPSTSDFTDVIRIDAMETTGILPSSFESQNNHQVLLDDSIMGLEALAASAAAASTSPSPTSSSIEFNEDEILGNLFNSSFDKSVLSNLYKEHCSAEFLIEAEEKLARIIEKSDKLLNSKGISMSLNSILPMFIERTIKHEVNRTKGKDFTKLLLDDNFLTSSAVVILMLPRLISILFNVEEVCDSLSSNLFDLLLSIEQVLRAIPELQNLPFTLKRLQELQNILLEESVWKADKDEDGRSSNVLYKLIESEFEEQKKLKDCDQLSISSTLTGIRSSQKALESLTGFPVLRVRLARLELFYRKYLRLAAHRLQYATIRLGLSQSVLQLSWEFFFELVQHDGGTDLFKNRHLNQILLSIIYCTSHLLEEDRTLQQISRVLPSIQSQTSWLNSINDGNEDFYSFYNEKFIPPLRKKMETFLSQQRDSSINVTERILNGLFTSAPFPSDQLYQLTPNITLNRLAKRQEPSSPIPTVKYEWTNPTSTQIPQTPTNTSQLFNISSSFSPPQAPETPRKRSTDSFDEIRLKKVARKLDFLNGD